MAHSRWFIVRINPDTPQVLCKFPDQQKKWEDGAKEKFWPEPSCVQGVRGFQLAKLLIHYGQFEFVVVRLLAVNCTISQAVIFAKECIAK
ncbi:hypothetical protein ROHU_016038 [Labeo rohita]|uniref:Uncharacterized protein n=1 Tax=Labeo rohita TaxID=84645 RepID=A0A498NM03_LABRO|nr:hypothetical protein ROHU_016038 [Labeo rohita]